MENNAKKISPMMQQYFEIKEQAKDSILFFRLGDFYEMFFDDALLVAKEIDLTLTGKSYGAEERAPMCGVPCFTADTYIAKLVERGHKIAICEQIEDPSLAKGLVKRAIVRIVTPGTLTSSDMLAEKENNYLMAVCIEENLIGIAYTDISTGEISCTQLKAAGDVRIELLQNEIVRIAPSELLLPAALYENEAKRIAAVSNSYVTPYDDAPKFKDMENIILAQFGVAALKGIGLEEKKAAVIALGKLLCYVRDMQMQSAEFVGKLNVYETSSHMNLDKATIRSLELVESFFDKKAKTNLLHVLDDTHTAMGARKLKQWIKEPLNDIAGINLRQNAVETLIENKLLLNNIVEILKSIRDLERLAGRIAWGNVNAPDLISLCNSIYNLPELKSDLAESGDEMLVGLSEEIEELNDIRERIEAAVVDEPPAVLREGGLIKRGYSDELDELKASISDGQKWIAGLEASEKERSGIKNLKVGFNKVFGYYIEITKSNYSMVPDNYIRKQTLANCERFITPELKEIESKVLNAENKINELEYRLFQELREHISGFIGDIQRTSAGIAVLDVLCSFAGVSRKMNYVKPVIHEGSEIAIKDGRHPVVEMMSDEGTFVSNDTYMNGDDAAMLIITGPNMAGKSTYMRQVALIVLMAQMGCFVPCTSARIGIVDNIFTRIGAADNLAQGQSTFFMEMSELAYILNTATEKSLIILDEIGRGTSTYDGLSIAWAAIEYLCPQGTPLELKRPKVRSLFATHYHELTVLEGMLAGVKNLNVDVLEDQGNVIFLHRIVEGSASRSYGIHVAKLAGVPKVLLDMASEKLDELESGGDLYCHGNRKNPLRPVDAAHDLHAVNACDENVQISFFDFASNEVVERLRNLDMMDLKPSEAYAILEELKLEAEKEL